MFKITANSFPIPSMKIREPRLARTSVGTLLGAGGDSPRRR